MKVDIGDCPQTETVINQLTDGLISGLDVGEPVGRIAEALKIIAAYGWIDGAHHKQWVLDQVIRVLAGEYYYEQIATADGAEWDQGIAP
ncbi:MAG: hypothetical protein AAFY78_24960 [Cyanobacteria bacterium J06648_16]